MRLTIGEKMIDIFRAENAAAPLVILNDFKSSGNEIYQACKALGCPDFTLAEITGLRWNDELSPRAAEPLGKNEPPFGGKADEYLGLLLEEILPAVTAELDGAPRRVLLAGYSMAGLFALYAATKCKAFQAVASCSGSLWFPGFKETMLTCGASGLPRAAYFSLGDREARTKNEILRTVEDNTKEIAARFAAQGVRTFFEMNKGNHFQQGALRTAKGITWIVENSENER